MQNMRNKAYQLLRRSEDFFKTDMVYLAKGGFWFTLAQTVVSLSSFFLAVAFAHFVTKEAYGQYKYILSIVGLLGAFTLSGLPSAVLRSVSNGHDGTLVYAFWQNLKWNVLFFIVALALSTYYFINGNSTLGISFLVVGSLWPIFQSTNLYNSYLLAKKDFKRSAMYFDVIGNLFPIFCLVITMLVTTNPVWLVTSYLASNTVIGLILYRRVLKVYHPGESIDHGTLSYGKHLSLINILSGIAAYLDQILVFHYIGAVELAIYNFAVAIPNQTKGPLKGLRNLMFPKFMERTDKEIELGNNRKFVLLFFLGLGLSLTYIAIAPLIFRIFFPNYLDAVFYSQIFSLSLINITFFPADVYLAARKKIKEQYLASISTSIIQIITVIVSIIYWGLLGLILARGIVRILSSFISFIIFRNTIKRAIISQ